MITAGLVFAALGALVHVYIFVLESVLWTTPRARAVFGTTPEDAQTTRQLAFNQGFYNLFLSIVTVIGIVVVATGSTTTGAALVLTGTGSMLAAAVVLVTSSPSKFSAALIQGVAPLAAVVLVVAGLLT
jgi:putative membrane protein